MSETQTLTPTLDVAAQTQSGITEITVGGFKSIVTKQSIEVRPLTILAGANSSGKSSIMQPVLLLKQTLDASYDPGPLLLDGPNVKSTSGQQLLARPGFAKGEGKSFIQNRLSAPDPADFFEVGVDAAPGEHLRIVFRYQRDLGFIVSENEVHTEANGTIRLRPEMPEDELASAGRSLMGPVREGGTWELARDRFLLFPEHVYGEGLRFRNSRTWMTVLALIKGLVHVPGLRGNRERTYPVTAVGPIFPGAFDNYVASVVYNWQIQDQPRLSRLNSQLEGIGLTRQAQALRINDAQFELHVDRLPAASVSAIDFVNIADVGFGVPTVLPVLVPLIAAEPAQAVYVEQPELHLHPRAQVKLAEVLADAAKRGVRVIAETHSSLLIRGIQTLVAKGNLDPKLVKLHWFTRSEEDGATTISSADLDENGAFTPSDWPIDFADVELRSEGDYLDAVGFGRK